MQFLGLNPVALFATVFALAGSAVGEFANLEPREQTSIEHVTDCRIRHTVTVTLYTQSSTDTDQPSSVDFGTNPPTSSAGPPTSTPGVISSNATSVAGLTSLTATPSTVPTATPISTLTAVPTTIDVTSISIVGPSLLISTVTTFPSPIVSSPAFSTPTAALSLGVPTTNAQGVPTPSTILPTGNHSAVTGTPAYTGSSDKLNIKFGMTFIAAGGIAIALLA